MWRDLNDYDSLLFASTKVITSYLVTCVCMSICLVCCRLRRVFVSHTSFAFLHSKEFRKQLAYLLKAIINKLTGMDER